MAAKEQDHGGPVHNEGGPQGRDAGLRRLAAAEEGMATAEYAIATLAAVGFAGLLVVILQSGEVRGLLMSIVERALSF